MTDGYKIYRLKELCDHHDQIDKELSILSDDMDKLPKLPDNLDDWIDSIPDGYNFKLSDFKKVFKITKKYNALVEESKKNASNVKIAMIDVLIDNINNILDE